MKTWDVTLVYLGWTIDNKTIVSTIINSMPSSYKYLEDFYTLADIEWTIENLINKIDHQENMKDEKTNEKMDSKNPFATNDEFKPKK